jgi:S-adenosylmethionine synthetase
MRSNYLFTSESVSEGHPDKVADQISDAVVDLFLSKDPVARVACETMVTTQRIVLAGEVRGHGMIDTEGNWAPGALRRSSGWRAKPSARSATSRKGFHWETAEFANHLHPQSAHIAQGVDESGNKDEGAGRPGHHVRLRDRRDSGPAPATLYYSHRILERLARTATTRWSIFLEPTPRAR